MPADPLEGSSPSSVAATPSPPDRPRPFSENRKSSKPIMEKRRRARINESLGQLKTLILDALKKDSSRHSKLEKADILEMTVKHLRGLQRVQMTAAVNADPSSLGKYRAGFGECVGEVTRFLSTCEGASAEVRARLLGHLAACASQINAVNFRGGHVASASSSYPPAAPPPPVNGVPCKSASVAVTVSAAEAVKLCGGYRVVAAPDGQFALLIPGAALAPLCAPPSGRPAHASPVAPHAADSVWRPW